MYVGAKPDGTPLVQSDVHDLADRYGIIPPMVWQLFHHGLLSDRDLVTEQRLTEIWQEKEEDHF